MLRYIITSDIVHSNELLNYKRTRKSLAHLLLELTRSVDNVFIRALAFNRMNISLYPIAGTKSSWEKESRNDEEEELPWIA